MSIIDLYMDILTIAVCMRYQAIAAADGNVALADKFDWLGTIQTRFLQIALIPRYFLFLWTLLWGGKYLPCKQFFMNHLFECEEDNWQKQFAGLMNLISDVLTGQFILNGKGDSNDLSY